MGGTPHPARKLIEPDAINAYLDVQRIPDQGEIELSKAISLKRIADILDANLGSKAHCDPFSIANSLSGIEMNGRQS